MQSLPSQPGRETVPYTGFQPFPLTFRAAARCCEGASCETRVLRERFCDACFAEAAKDMARQIETRLIGQGHRPGTDELRAALAGYAPMLGPGWYRISSPLGLLDRFEAIRLRNLTDSACLLVSLGGVSALANLPGTRTEPETPPAPRTPTKVTEMPLREQRGLRRRFSAETRFQIGTILALLVLAVLAVSW